MSEVNAASCGNGDRHTPGVSNFQERVLAMLEGAAFALLQNQIKDRENAVYTAAVNKLKHEREEVARRELEVAAKEKDAQQMMTNAREYHARVRKRVKRAVRAADIYRKAVEEIRERIEELVDAADGFGISNELEAIIELIEKTSTMDPDFQP